MGELHAPEGPGSTCGSSGAPSPAGAVPAVDGIDRVLLASAPVPDGCKPDGGIVGLAGPRGFLLLRKVVSESNRSARLVHEPYLLPIEFVWRQFQRVSQAIIQREGGF